MVQLGGVNLKVWELFILIFCPLIGNVLALSWLENGSRRLETSAKSRALMSSDLALIHLSVL